MKLTKILSLILLIVISTWHNLIVAACQNVLEQANHMNPTHRDNAAFLHFGTISKPSGSSGSLLASITIDHTRFVHKTFAPDTIIWECDANTKTAHLLITTRTVGPRHGGVAVDGDIFYTRIKSIGLQLIMGGESFNQNWKTVHLTRLPDPHPTKKGYKVIRLNHIPPVTANLYHVSSRNGFGTDRCDKFMADTSNPNDPEITCAYPNGYVHLAYSGDGNNIQAGHKPKFTDSVKEPTGSLYNGDDRYVVGGNGFGYTFYGNAVYDLATCYPVDGRQDVVFKPLFLKDLTAVPPDHVFESKSFSVEIACNKGFSFNPSETGKHTRIGLQMSSAAAKNLNSLGLLKGGEYSNYLVSDRYFDADFAQGIGVNIKYDNQLVRFLKHEATIKPNANNFRVITKETKIGSGTAPDSTKHRLNFEANLIKLPITDLPKAGKIHASATVVLRVL